MPRTQEQNEAIRTETRARIMEAALALFSECGYEGTSVHAIARRAGVAQGLLYSYFAGKEQLLVELFRASIRDVRASFAAAEIAGPPNQRIEGLIRGAFAIVRRKRTFWRLSYAVRMQPAVLAALSTDMPSWTDEIMRTLVRYFEEIGTASPQIEAAILFALIDGVAQHYVLDPEHYPLDAVEDTLVERYRVGKEQRR